MRFNFMFLNTFFVKYMFDLILCFDQKISIEKKAYFHCQTILNLGTG
jgi:hypothetical protein